MRRNEVESQCVDYQEYCAFVSWWDGACCAVVEFREGEAGEEKAVRKEVYPCEMDKKHPE